MVFFNEDIFIVVLVIVYGLFNWIVVEMVLIFFGDKIFVLIESLR